MVYQGGRIYEGEWLNNKKHGNGFEIFENSDKFQGEYKFGKPNGFGIF